MLTFRRVFPIVLLSMVFVLAVRQSVSIDPDLWWHLKAGQDILDTRSIPHTDDYSFTKQGSEWVAHEWLSEVIIASIYRVGGLVSLVTIFSFVIVIALWLTYRRCEGRPYAAGIAILLAAAASSPLFGIRPQMLTLLLASIYILLLERFDPKEKNRRLWWLPPLMLLWVNLHAGFALGLVLIGLYIIRAVLDGQRDRVWPLLIVLVICTAVVPLNPNGLRMFSYPYETLTSPSMAAFIQEWASPDFHKVTYLPLAIFLLSTFAAMALSPKRGRLGEVFLVLITALGALRSVRHIPIFSLFCGAGARETSMGHRRGTRLGQVADGGRNSRDGPKAHNQRRPSACAPGVDCLSHLALRDAPALLRDDQKPCSRSRVPQIAAFARADL